MPVEMTMLATGQAMKHQSLILFILFASLCFTGCQSTGPTNVSQTGTEKARYAPESKTKGAIYVFNTMPKSFSKYSLQLDGKEIGRISGKEYTWFQLEPGSYKVTVNTSTSGRILAGSTIDLKKNQSRYLIYNGDDPKGHYSDGVALFMMFHEAVSGKKDTYHGSLYRFTRDEATRFLQTFRVIENSVEKD